MSRRLEICLALAGLGIALLTFLSNPCRGVLGVDSSIFVYVARQMGAGQVPYLDVFDQKGLLIYALDWLGWSCGGVMGIWLLDCVALVLALGLFRKLGADWVALMVLCVFYHFVACGGNMPEMWIIVFSGLAYWLALKQLNGEGRRWHWLVMGVCVAQILMLKLNMIAVVVPIMLCWVDVTQMLCRRRLPRFAFLRVGILLALGLSIGLVSYVLYFTLTGSWGALWEVYVQYNAQYAAHGGWMPNITRAFWPVLGVLLINLRLCAVERTNKVAWINLAYLIAALGLILISGGSFRYYGPVLPACVIPLAWVSRRLEKTNWGRISKVAICFGCLMFLGGLAWGRNHQAAAIRAMYDRVAAAVEEHVQDKTSVTVLGCDCYVYLRTETTCPGRFPFQGTIAACSAEYRDRMVADLKEGKSRYLIVPRESSDPQSVHYLAWAMPVVETGYRKIWDNGEYAIWEVVSATRRISTGEAAAKRSLESCASGTVLAAPRVWGVGGSDVLLK